MKILILIILGRLLTFIEVSLYLPGNFIKNSFEELFLMKDDDEER